MKKKIVFWVFVLFFYSCYLNKNSIKTDTLSPKEKEIIQLGKIEKIEIPRIEGKEKFFKVLIWGEKPSVYSKEKETIIERTDTGYLIKILFQPSAEKSEIKFYKEVCLQIPKPGGYDIEVMGQNSSVIDIVYIDE